MTMKGSGPTEQGDQGYYLARPQSGVGKPVLVLHAWWGLNPFVQGFCDRLAAEGFIALAPDLYHGAVAATIAQAETLSAKLDPTAVERALAKAVAQLKAVPGVQARKVGVVGFSLGGFWAMWLTKQESSPIAAAVVFYATRADDYAGSQAAYQFHLAETDPYEPPSEVEAIKSRLKSAGKRAVFYTYPGTTHWFFEDDRTDAYRAEAAALAWKRAVDFLRMHLGEI